MVLLLHFLFLVKIRVKIRPFRYGNKYWVRKEEELLKILLKSDRFGMEIYSPTMITPCFMLLKSDRFGMEIYVGEKLMKKSLKS